MLTIVHYLVLKGLDTAYAHTENYTYAIFVQCLQVHAAVLNGLNGRHHGILGIFIHLAHFFAVYVLGHIQVLHLAGKMGLKQAAVEIGDGSGSAHTCHQILPCLIRGVTHRSHSTKSCHYNSFQFHKKASNYYGL